MKVPIPMAKWKVMLMLALTLLLETSEKEVLCDRRGVVDLFQYNILFEEIVMYARKCRMLLFSRNREEWNVDMKISENAKVVHLFGMYWYIAYMQGHEVIKKSVEHLFITETVCVSPDRADSRPIIPSPSSSSSPSPV